MVILSLFFFLLLKLVPPEARNYGDNGRLASIYNPFLFSSKFSSCQFHSRLLTYCQKKMMNCIAWNGVFKDGPRIHS